MPSKDKKSTGRKVAQPKGQVNRREKEANPALSSLRKRGPIPKIKEKAPSLSSRASQKRDPGPAASRPRAKSKTSRPQILPTKLNPRAVLRPALTTFIVVAGFLWLFSGAAGHLGIAQLRADGSLSLTGVQSRQQSAEINPNKAPFVPLAGAPTIHRALQVPILMYHHIGATPPDADPIRRDLTVSGSDFTAQLDWLRSKGYHTVSLADLYNALYRGQHLAKKPIVLTFDDGYADNSETALPILQSHTMTGTFYIISGMVGDPGYMTWDQVRAAHLQGIEIGSHTVHHVDLEKAQPEQRHAELVDSKRKIEQQLGQGIYMFCFPSGKYNQDVIDELRRDGYATATTTKVGDIQDTNNPFEMPRLRVGGGEPLDKFAEAVTQGTAPAGSNLDPATAP